MKKEWKIPEFEPETQPVREEGDINILIMALSTFGSDAQGNVSPCSLACEIPGMYVPDEKYYYQMEPVPMMLTCSLKRGGKQIDEVIMICSGAALRKGDKKLCLKAAEDDEHAQDVELVSSSGGGQGVSARDYFVEFLKRYMTKRGCREPYFFEVDYSEGDMEGAQSKVIARIVSEIRKHPGAAVYVDTHGGPRTYQAVIDSILSLLRAEGIGIDANHMFAVDFVRPTGTIVPAGLSLEILDFVSGMNELINYGRTDTLKRFFKDDRANDEDRELIDTAAQIGVAIQLCDICGFEEKLDDLKRILEFRALVSADQNPLLNLFAGNIKNNYKGLLKDGRTVIDEIRWCLEKGFYQQVLTLIESRIPAYLHEKKIFCYSEILKRDRDIDKDNPDTDLFNKTVAGVIPKRERLNFFSGRGESSFQNYLVSRIGQKYVEVRVNGENAKSFLRLHMGLKELRNISNHAGENFMLPKREDFESRTYRYLETVKMLTDQTENKDYCEKIEVRGPYFNKEVIVCLMKRENNWPEEFKNDLLQFGKYINIGGPPYVSEDDKPENVIEKAEKLKTKIEKNIRPSAGGTAVILRVYDDYDNQVQFSQIIYDWLRECSVDLFIPEYDRGNYIGLKKRPLTSGHN